MAAAALAVLVLDMSVLLKPCVLFVETPSGAVLMDVDGDRFVALSTISAFIWRKLADGRTRAELIDEIAVATGVARDLSERVLTSQLDKWEKSQLVNIESKSKALPSPKRLRKTLRHEMWRTETTAALSPSLMLSLYFSELRYRRLITRVGLAGTLTFLQTQSGGAALSRSRIIDRTLGSYHALRRLFRQGEQARDCLFRSLALATVLRRQGVDAELCIAIVDIPFASHAWVEVDGFVLNETEVKCQRYRAIGRF